MKIGDYEVTIGADPEVFLFSGGKPVSPHGIIPGSKYEPFKLKRGAIQCDGLAAEANVAPSRTAYQFMLNTLYVQREIKRRLAKDMEYVNTSVVEFDKEYFDAQPPDVKVLGCEPDYCIYEKDPMKPVENPNLDNNNTTRTAGGHIHIGWTEGQDINDPNHMKKCMQLVHALEPLVGIPLYDLADDPTKTERAKFYGQWGSFRPKPYGLEYRTPGNNWIRNSELIKFVFAQTCAAFKYVAVEQYRYKTPKYNITNYWLNRTKTHLTDDFFYDLPHSLRRKLNTFVKLRERREELNRERVV